MVLAYYHEVADSLEDGSPPSISLDRLADSSLSFSESFGYVFLFPTSLAWRQPVL